MLMRLTAATVTIFLTTAPAQADWHYVRWGMSAVEAVAASKGEAKPTSGDGRNIVCAFNDQRPAAYVQQKKIAGMNMQVIICAGGNGKISSVVVRPKPEAGSYNSLRSALIGQYGQPIEDGRGDLATTTWRDVKGKNLVRLLRVIDGGSIEYRMLATGL